jgi:hypothetical protein
VVVGGAVGECDYGVWVFGECFVGFGFGFGFWFFGVEQFLRRRRRLGLTARSPSPSGASVRAELAVSALGPADLPRTPGRDGGQTDHDHGDLQGSLRGV